MQDGIQKLQKALELRPDYDDAMAYLNLLYREEADLQCDNPDARKTDLKTADDWVDKTMATKKAKAEKAGPTGVVTMQQQLRGAIVRKRPSVRRGVFVVGLGRQ